MLVNIKCWSCARWLCHFNLIVIKNIHPQVESTQTRTSHVSQWIFMSFLDCFKTQQKNLNKTAVVGEMLNLSKQCSNIVEVCRKNYAFFGYSLLIAIHLHIVQQRIFFFYKVSRFFFWTALDRMIHKLSCCLGSNFQNLKAFYCVVCKFMELIPFM